MSVVRVAPLQRSPGGTCNFKTVQGLAHSPKMMLIKGQASLCSHALRLNDNRQSMEGSMEIMTRYKVISGASAEIEQKLNVLSQDGWRPVTMSCLGRPSVLTVILENKIMEEAKLSMSRPRDESTLEEVQ